MASRSSSHSRSRTSSRSNAFKLASALENGSQPPVQDEPNFPGQDEIIELVSRNSQSIPHHSPRLPPESSGMFSAVPPPGAMNNRVESHIQPDPPTDNQQTRFPHKRFGLHTDQHRSQPVQGAPMNYKQKYPEDPTYKETESDARVWHVYNDECQLFDNDMVIEAGDNLDILLVFAGLFSAVLTTFVAQTSQSLSPDKTDLSNSLLREMISLQRAQENGTSFASIPPADASFTASRTDLWVNSLWFVSLALSLSTALLAVIAKQWLRQYSSFIPGSARTRALTRQLRYVGLEKWGVRLIISLLPTILHVSLFLFMSGLVVFLFPLNDTLACVVAVIAGFLCATYVITNFLPVIFHQCPYRTPLSEILNTLYRATQALFLLPWLYFLTLLERLNVATRDDLRDLGPEWVDKQMEGFTGGWFRSLREVERALADEADKWGRPLGISGALVWLAQTTPDMSAKAIIAEAVGSVSNPFQRDNSVRTPLGDVLIQQWQNICSRMRAGELLVAEDERVFERLMRSRFLMATFMLFLDLPNPLGQAELKDCQAYSTVLINATFRRHSILHSEDGNAHDIPPALVFRFIGERADLSVEFEAPTWMWWSLFSRAAGENRVDLLSIFKDGSTPHIEFHKEIWLKRLDIPSTLRDMVRERMLTTYFARFWEGPIPTDKIIVAAFYVAQAREAKNPPAPFSTVSLVTFLFENFSQFAGFWMDIYE